MTTPITPLYTRPQSELRCEDVAAATYQIETLTDGVWTTDGIGDPDANEFDTREQAEECIAELRTIGDDWAEAEYQVTVATPGDYTDTAIEQGVVEFTAGGERYQYHDRGAGVWSRYEWDADNFGGGCYIHTGIVAAPADATPRQLHRA